MSLKLILPIITLFFSITALTKNMQLDALVDCWSAIRGRPYGVKSFGLNQDFHLVHVQRFDKKQKDASELIIGKDNFLVFNRDGAQLLTPTADRTPHPKYGDNKMNNYQLTVTAPGENKKIQMGYFISLEKPEFDTAGWYGAPGFSKEKDELYAKYEKDPVKPIIGNDKLNDIMEEIIESKVAINKSTLEKTKERLKFYFESEHYSTNNGFSTRSLGDGKKNEQRITYEQEKLDKSLEQIKACNNVSNKKIQQAGQEQENTLLALKEYVDRFKPKKDNTDEKSEQNIK